MGKKQRDCARCGAPVGYLDRDLCWSCTRREVAAAQRVECPRCGQQRRMCPDTGVCALCSKVCLRCGHRVRRAGVVLCKECRRKQAAADVKQPCPRCGRPGLIRPGSGWCGTCSRPKPARKPARTCTACAASTTHPINGLCPRCWQRDPARPLTRGQHLLEQLACVPDWLEGFLDEATTAYSPARATMLIAALSKVLQDGGTTHPHAVLQRARRPGRSVGPLALVLEAYFVRHHLAPGLDHAAHLAHQRRRRRVEAVPEPLRGAADGFTTYLTTSNDRARRAGTRPRSASTLDSTTATIRDFALFLQRHGKPAWSLASRDDVETFIADRAPGYRPRTLTALRQFFRWAKTNKLILIDPTAGVRAPQHRGFTGATVALHHQRVLYQRWTHAADAHPHEAFVGLLCLLHGASVQEIRDLKITDLNPAPRTIQLGKRPLPTPLDPATWDALQRVVAHRAATATWNPHLLVTRSTKGDLRPASPAYLTHVLDPAGIRPRLLRVTRLATLVNDTDPRLVATAFGLRPEGVIDYLADHVDPTRIPEHP